MDSSALKVLGGWLPAFCAGQDGETHSHQQAIRHLPTPSGPGEVTALSLVFLPCD